MVQHATISCKFLNAAFHIARQCIGLVHLDDGVVDDPEEIIWEQAALSVSSPLDSCTGQQSGPVGSCDQRTSSLYTPPPASGTTS